MKVCLEGVAGFCPTTYGILWLCREVCAERQPLVFVYPFDCTSPIKHSVNFEHVSKVLEVIGKDSCITQGWHDNKNNYGGTTMRVTHDYVLFESMISVSELAMAERVFEINGMWSHPDGGCSPSCSRLACIAAVPSISDFVSRKYSLSLTLWQTYYTLFDLLPAGDTKASCMIGVAQQLARAAQSLMPFRSTWSYG